MAPSDVAVRPRRSAFAAAFLSFIFPGLGHAYLGRWLRALAWAALPIVLIAAAAGRVVSGGRSELVELVADPGVLNAMLIFLALDVIYRLLALLDAYRLATDRSVGSIVHPHRLDGRPHGAGHRTGGQPRGGGATHLLRH